MSQTFTEDCFAGGHVAQTDMQNIENNFAALKSCFSGSSAPSNLVAGMWWFDTTDNILKLRNEANDAWLNVYDFANQVSYGAKGITITAGTGLSGGGELTTNRTISHGSHTGDVTGTGALTLADGIVKQTKLDVSEQSQSYDIPNIGGGVPTYKFILTGGMYCFRPTYKGEDANIKLEDSSIALTTSYATITQLKNYSTSFFRYGYCKHQYITSSGEIYWIFLLRDKITKKIIGTSCAPDHPCFSNDSIGDPDIVPHPFGEGYDPNLHEIVVVNPLAKQVIQIYDRAAIKPARCITQVIHEDYGLNDAIFFPAWPNKKITVGLPPNWRFTKKIGDLIDPIKQEIPKLPGSKMGTLKLKR